MASHSHYDIFLSYQWNNQEQIKSFSKTLKDSFGYSVFLDINYLNSGRTLADELSKAISASDLFICFVTKAYSNSDNCIKEFKWATEQNKKIVVVMLENFDQSELNSGDEYDILPTLRIDLYKDAQLFDQNGIEYKRLVDEIIKNIGIRNREIYIGQKKITNVMAKELVIT